MVGQVERFGSKLNRLGFPDVELSRQSHVDIDLSRPLSIDVAGSPLAIRWPPEGRRVQVLSGALIRSIDIGEELIRAVSPLRAAKAGIKAGRHGKVAAGLQADKTRDLPVAGQDLHRFAGKLRRRIHRGEIRHLPAVSITIPAFVEPAAGILRRRTDSGLTVSGIADAVGPGVIPLHG